MDSIKFATKQYSDQKTIHWIFLSSHIAIFRL